jgi:hypothetical protein
LARKSNPENLSGLESSKNLDLLSFVRIIVQLNRISKNKWGAAKKQAPFDTLHFVPLLRMLVSYRKNNLEE